MDQKSQQNDIDTLLRGLTHLRERINQTYATLVDLIHAGASGPGHDPVTLASPELQALLSLTGQALDLEVQSASTAFLGPLSGEAARPAFRALEMDDLPGGLLTQAAGDARYWRFNRIVLTDGNSWLTYDNNDAGMASALSESESGDTVWLPACALSGSYTIPAGVTVCGISQEDTVFTGELTLSDGSVLEDLSILREEGEEGAIFGLVEEEGEITGTLRNVSIHVANATGAAYAVYINNGGSIYAYHTNLIAASGSEGYAAQVNNGYLYHFGGRAVGTTPLFPYDC